jgi:hypothetical protein
VTITIYRAPRTEEVRPFDEEEFAARAQPAELVVRPSLWPAAVTGGLSGGLIYLLLHGF